MKGKIWIVTREVNEYEQYGEYFHCAFRLRPTEGQLKGIGVDHIGRNGTEYEWFNLHEIEFTSIFK